MDIVLHYSITGDGMPLVLLHGNGENSAYFSHQIAYFSPSYRVIAVDTRGHGDSPRGKAPFTLAQFAEDLKALLDMLSVEKCLLLGFSDGANIALLFALKYPQYIEKLVINGGNLSPSGVKVSSQLPICIGYGIVSFIALFDKKAIPNKELLALMVTQPHIKPDELASLTVPTLVIVGENDMIKDSHSRLIAASLPHAVYRSIPGNHFIAAKQSEAFNLEVAIFLQNDENKGVTYQ